MTAENPLPIRTIRSSTRLMFTPGTRSAFLLAAASFIVVFVLWQDTTGFWLLYPFRLLVTFVHETGHGLAAVLTGGTFYTFQIYGNGSGVAYTIGGARLLITSMGYLGASLFGAALFLIANRAPNVKLVARGAGIFFVGCALLFATRSAGGMTGVFGSILACGIGIACGLGLLALSVQRSQMLTLFILNALSFIIGFNALSDILYLMTNRDASVGSIPNDAQVMALLTHIPAEFWIVLWLVLSIGIMGTTILYTLLMPAPEPSD